MRHRISTSAAPALVFLFISLLFIGASSPVSAKFRGPEALAVSPDGKRVYVTDTARAGVDVIDAETHQLISTIPVSDQFYLPGLAVSPDGSQLYETDLRQLNVISTTLGKVVAQVKVGKQPTKVVVSPDGQRLFVMDPSANLVSVVDTASDQVTATIPVGTNPQGLAISPDGSRLYVANRGYNTSTNGRSQLNGSVSVIDAPRNKVVVTVPVHTAPWAVTVSPDGQRIYVTHTDTASSQVDVISAKTNQLMWDASGIPGGYSGAIATSPDSKRLYVLPPPWNVLAAVDPTSRQVIGAAGVGQGPIDLAVSPGGRRLYVSNALSQTVSVIDAGTFQTVATVNLGQSATSGQ